MIGSRSAYGRTAAGTYYLYGMRVRSEWPLPYATRARDGLAEIGLVRGSAARFARAVGEARATGRNEHTWLRGVDLNDGQTYLRWIDRFEFLISRDGRSIAARPLNGEPPETFHACLLGPAMSFALIRQGFDPLHATTVTIDGAAVAFLGDTGYGKSTLAAALLQAGHRVLTDDLLVLSQSAGSFVAHPGPPRIKLFPAIARRLFHTNVQGTPFGPSTRKQIIPLDGRHASPSAVPIKAMYVLAPPERRRSRTRVTIRRVSKRRACLALIRNAFNTAVTDPQRLSRQFSFAAGVAAIVPIRSIAYPRTIGALARTRDAILADLARI